MTVSWHENFGGSGLTRDQYYDCINAGRSTKTGRHVRTSEPSKLERRAKQVNWNKLLITGAACNLSKVLGDMNISADQRQHASEAIRKLEQLMLNRLAEDYEVFKAEYLAAKGGAK